MPSPQRACRSHAARAGCRRAHAPGKLALPLAASQRRVCRKPRPQAAIPLSFFPLLSLAFPVLILVAQRAALARLVGSQLRAQVGQVRLGQPKTLLSRSLRRLCVFLLLIRSRHRSAASTAVIIAV